MRTGRSGATSAGDVARADSPRASATHCPVDRKDRPGPGLWTKSDGARFLGVAVRSVERMDIPRVNLTITGRRPLVRFDPVQVQEWVDARRTRPRRGSGL